MPENPVVVVLNESSAIADADVEGALLALQTQLDRDFAPAWHTAATLSFVAAGSAPPADAWQLVVLDDSDQAEALGYHDLTAEGLPLGKVFAATAAEAGAPWTVVASHELLELLGDPYIDLTVFDQSSATAGTLYALEACDAVQADTYELDGVAVSDFVTPEWFGPPTPAPAAALDQLGLVTAPLELRPGGYIGVFDVTAGSGWTRRTAGAAVVHCSRWQRRTTARSLRRRSRQQPRRSRP
jgi:hypothetical protein